MYDSQASTLASGVIAFSAYATEEIEYKSAEIIAFPSVLSNIGSAYDESISRFTCPTNGLYMFTTSAFTNHGVRAELVLTKNGDDSIATAFSEDNSDAMSTLTVFVECNEDEYVEVMCGPSNNVCKCNADEYLATVTFSGMLVGMIV